MKYIKKTIANSSTNRKARYVAVINRIFMKYVSTRVGIFMTDTWKINSVHRSRVTGEMLGYLNAEGHFVQVSI